MNKELFKYYKMHKLVSVYVEIENTDSFLTGFINSLDDEGFIINHISPYGQYDGYIYIKIEDVYRLEVDSQYIKKIEKLMSVNYVKKHQKINIDAEKTLFLNFLIFAKHYQKLISIELGDESFFSITGFIEKIEHNILKINQIDEEGKTDGVSFIKMFQINSCQCDTIDEQIIMQLYQNK
jgi:hypothetical protein